MSSVACVNVYARYIFTGRMKGTCMNEDYDGKMQGYAASKDDKLFHNKSTNLEE